MASFTGPWWSRTRAAPLGIPGAGRPGRPAGRRDQVSPSGGDLLLKPVLDWIEAQMFRSTGWRFVDAAGLSAGEGPEDGTGGGAEGFPQVYEEAQCTSRARAWLKATRKRAAGPVILPTDALERLFAHRRAAVRGRPRAEDGRGLVFHEMIG